MSRSASSKTRYAGNDLSLEVVSFGFASETQIGGSSRSSYTATDAVAIERLFHELVETVAVRPQRQDKPVALRLNPPVRFTGEVEFRPGLDSHRTGGGVVSTAPSPSGPFASELPSIENAASIGELYDIVNSYSARTTGPDALLYGGQVGPFSSSAIVQQVDDHSDLPTVEKTDRGKFLSDKDVQDAPTRSGANDL